MQSYALVLVSCLLASASAWNCPSLPVVDTVNVTALAGAWFQQSQAGAALFALPGQCTWVQYTPDTTNKTLFSLSFTEDVLLTQVTLDGWAQYADITNPNGKLRITITTPLFDQTTDLWVLDTDYDNFLILYSCKKVFGIPIQSSWIFSRIQNPTGDDKTRLDQLLATAFVKISKAGGPDIKDFKKTTQQGC